MVHSHTVHLPRGELLTLCTMCGTGEVLSRALRNRALERPLWHAQYAVSNHLTRPTTHHEAALAYIDSDACTPAAVAAHLRSLLRANFAELLVHGNLLPEQATLSLTLTPTLTLTRTLTLTGNLLPEQALALGRDWRSVLSDSHPTARALPPDCAPLPTARLLPSVAEGGGGAPPLRGVAANPEEVNSAVEVHFQVSEDPPLGEEALLLALAQVASKHAFYELRTVKQLGEEPPHLPPSVP